MGGCLIAFLVVFGLFIVGAGVAGFLIYRKVGGFVGAAKDMVVEVQAATKAPGTKELRKLGCEEAVALDGRKLLKIAQRMEDEVAKQQGREPKKVDDKEVTTYVYCKNNVGDELTCDEIAKTYVDAVHPDQQFVVSVTRLNQNKCSGSYAADGKHLGDAEAPEIPSAGE
jgi:hypothetical protein